MLRPGAQLGRYRVEAILGHGSFGTVVRAHDALLQEPIALKVLHKELARDVVVIERLRREVLVARRIDHPNVCRIHDLQQDGEQLFVVMELVEGRTLDALLNEGPLSPLRAAHIIEQVCRALAAAHAAGVLHRDIKPGNVMVRPGDDVRLVDFGIATMQGLERLTRPGIALGSMGYVAPERWSGAEATTASDVFAAGVLLYASLTRRMPWNATGLQLVQQMKNVPAAPPSVFAPGVGPALDSIALAAIAVDPRARTPSAAALADALAACGASASSASSPSASDAVPTSRVRLTLALGAAAVAAGAVTVALWTARPAPAPAESAAVGPAERPVTQVAPAVDDVGSAAAPGDQDPESADAGRLVHKRSAPADRALVEQKLARLQQRAGDTTNPALDKLAAQIAADIAAERYAAANAKLDRALALVR